MREKEKETDIEGDGGWVRERVRQCKPNQTKPNQTKPNQKKKKKK